ncbi:hypothetical protein DRO58_08010, partial [Candidatus Bathyarchaeota archaeon]
RDPVDWFLFEERRGVCVNFNSAFVILMRASGIPSRLVAGYAINSTTHYQKVYADQAHAWAEVKFKGLGGVGFDATAPSRLSTSSLPPPTSTSRIRTFTQITYVDSSVVKGKLFNVKGKVFDENGEPVNGLKVVVYLKESKEDEDGILCGKGTVSNGEFTIPCRPPPDMKVGDYHVVAHTIGDEKYEDSESDPTVTVKAEVEIKLEVPEWWILGRIFTVSGCVKEKESGKAVDSLTVSLQVGSKSFKIKTDKEGVFRLAYSINKPGNYSVSAEPSRSPYYFGSKRETKIEVFPIDLTITTPQNLTRLSKVTFSGKLTAGKHSVPKEPLSIYFNNKLVSTVLSDESGKFNVDYYIPRSQSLGKKPVLYKLSKYPLQKSQMVTVYAKSKLTYRSLNEVNAESSFNITARLEDDLGDPIKDARLTLRYVNKGQTVTIHSVTNASGCSVFTIDLPPDYSENTFNFTLSFPGDDFYLPAKAAGQIRLRRTPLFNVYFVAVPAVAFMVVCAFLFYRKRRSSRKIGSSQTVLTQIKPSGSRRVFIDIVFPQICELFPDVWGVGESLSIAIYLGTSDTPIKDSVKLTLDGTHEVELTTDEYGKASVTRVFKEKGLHKIRAEYSGDKLQDVAPNERDIRIVDYREEVINLFNSIFDLLRSKGVDISEETTPREFQKAVIDSFSGVNRRALDEFISLFEVAEYSLHPVGRREYEKTYLLHVYLKNFIGGE